MPCSGVDLMRRFRLHQFLQAWGFVFLFGWTWVDHLSVAAENTSSSSYPDCSGYIPFIADAVCDEQNNNVECGYDGGDCCLCSCVDSPSAVCGWQVDFNCTDPNVPDDCGTTPSPAAAFGYPNCTGYLWSIQNGYCDYDLNSEECGYDGGDCCRCTCRVEVWYESSCGLYGYDCLDPDAPTDCPTPTPTFSPAAAVGFPGCTGDMSDLRNGYCDWDLNNDKCGYDLGDCCRCTCVDGISYNCGEYGFDCVDPTVPTDCDTASPTPSPAAASGYPGCTGYMPDLNNGYCDSDLNNEECGYDLGDCCRCTCEDGISYSCGEYGFDCVDPTAPTDCPTSSPTSSPAAALGYPSCAGDMSDLQNGYCDWDLNSENCGYDGGDCCRCTCEDGIYYDCGEYGFDCVDPSAPTDCPTPSPTVSPAATLGYPDCSGYMPDLQNGYCDWDLNSENCGYDGGDCCSCTCEDGVYYYCGEYGFDCVDPNAPTDCPTPSPTISPAAALGYPDCTGDMSDLQNGYCDWDLNDENCGYDGGDCCRCTCEDGVYYECGEYGFDCVDPTALIDCPTPSPTLSPAGILGYPNCTGDMSDLENGYCDWDLNNDECGYDGGDCCRCTCEDGISYDCGEYGFDCVDPSAPTDCPTPSPTATSYCTGNTSDLQNGNCDSDLNNENCGYDGGDCCRCTCEDGAFYDCGYSGFDCVEPTAPTDCPTPSPTLNPTAGQGFPDCLADMNGFENGYCDWYLNDEECGYDGGDCCECTCTVNFGDDVCGQLGYDCREPDACLAVQSGENSSSMPVSVGITVLIAFLCAVAGCASCLCIMCIRSKWRSRPATTQADTNPTPRSPPPVYEATVRGQQHESTNVTIVEPVSRQQIVVPPIGPSGYPDQVHVVHPQSATLQGGRGPRVVMPWSRRAPLEHASPIAVRSFVPQPSAPPGPPEPEAPPSHPEAPHPHPEAPHPHPEAPAASIPRGETLSTPWRKALTRIAFFRSAFVQEVNTQTVEGPRRIAEVESRTNAELRQAMGPQLAVASNRRPQRSSHEMAVAEERKRLEVALARSRRVQTIAEAIFQQETPLTHTSASDAAQSGTGESPQTNVDENVSSAHKMGSQDAGNRNDWRKDRETNAEEKILHEYVRLGAKGHQLSDAAVAKTDCNDNQQEDMVKPLQTIQEDEAPDFIKKAGSEAPDNLMEDIVDPDPRVSVKEEYLKEGDREEDTATKTGSKSDSCFTTGKGKQGVRVEEADETMCTE